MVSDASPAAIIASKRSTAMRMSRTIGLPPRMSALSIAAEKCAYLVIPRYAT